MSNPIQIKYSYLGNPTLERFSNSNAFIRGLMGPYGCLSGDTEFLTPNGWRRIDAYRPGDKVLQWWPSGATEFVEPEAYVELPCEELIEFDSGSLVMRLSDEHRVPHLNWAGRFQVKTAAEIARRPSRRMIPTTFGGQNQLRLDASDDLIRFAVMMNADGHYPKQGQKASVSLRKERKKERLRALLTRLGVAYTESVYPNRPTESVFRFVPPIYSKRFSGAWWSANHHQLQVIFDEMRYWDGHQSEYLLYTSTHAEDADFIQYAAHACGFRASIGRTDYDDQNRRTLYRVNIRQSDNAKNRAAIREHTKIRRVPALNGRKYCFSVATGFFVARCDGTVFITGNSGKSSASVIEIINRAQEQRRSPDGKRKSRWAVIRNTFPELRNTTIKTVFEWMPPKHFGKYVENRHTYTVEALQDCEVEIIFLALDKPDDMKQLLSLELTGAWVNEAREVPWAVIEALQGRVNRYPSMKDGGPSWTGIWMDTNPPDTDSKWYKFFEEQNWLKDFQRLQREGHLPMSMRPEDYVSIFKQPGGLAENAENISNLQGGKLYYARLVAGKSPEWIKIYVNGEYGFVIDGRPVYPEYNDAVHCKEVEPVEGLPIYRGWDFGLTPACTFSQELPDGRWLVFDEMVSESMGIDRFSDEVLEHCGRAFRGANVRFIDDGDPAGQQRVQTDERTCFEILHAKNIMIEPSEVSVAKRMESVRLPMRRMAGDGAQFVLHPRCRKLRKGFMGGYRFRRMQVSGERYTEKPDKNEYSHCFPAGTLVSTPEGPVEIENLRIGDLVSTPIGPKRVSATMTSAADRFVSLRTAEGRFLLCTDNHPIYREDGFVRADALRYGDSLTVEEPIWAAPASTPFRSSTGFATTESQPDTTRQTTASAASTCTAPSGSTIEDRFLTASTSTTRMRTKATTTSKTSNSSAHLSTSRCTVSSGTPPIPSAPDRTWRLSGLPHRTGIGLMRAALGIVSTVDLWLSAHLWSATPAFAAARSTRSSAAAGSAGSALRPAKPPLAEPRASMTSSGHAPSAGRPTPPTATPRSGHAADRIVALSISEQPETQVFDLTVEDAHCFYANGILVKNCHDALQYTACRLFGGMLVSPRFQEEAPPFSGEAVDLMGFGGGRSEFTGY